MKLPSDWNENHKKAWSKIKYLIDRLSKERAFLFSQVTPLDIEGDLFEIRIVGIEGEFSQVINGVEKC